MTTRDLVVTENITLDGVIEASEGWFDVADTADADFMGVQEEHRDGADALLVGRESYPAVLGRGRRLFEGATDVGPAAPGGGQTLPLGITLLRYRTA